MNPLSELLRIGLFSDVFAEFLATTLIEFNVDFWAQFPFFNGFFDFFSAFWTFHSIQFSIAKIYCMVFLYLSMPESRHENCHCYMAKASYSLHLSMPNEQVDHKIYEKFSLAFSGIFLKNMCCSIVGFFRVCLVCFV